MVVGSGPVMHINTMVCVCVGGGSPVSWCLHSCYHDPHNERQTHWSVTTNRCLCGLQTARISWRHCSNI